MIEELIFEHPEALGVGVFIIIFSISNYFINKILRNNKGISILVSFIIAVIAAWNIYKERFYGWEGVLAIVLVIVAIAIFFKIFSKVASVFRR